MMIKLRKEDRDTRVVDIDGRRFEVVTCRNTRGNVDGFGIFERWSEPRRIGPNRILAYGEWQIDPAQASFGECRKWLDAFARGENPKPVSWGVW